MTSALFQPIVTEGWQDYRLIDMGHGRKLEQCGPYLIDRPEPQAMGTPLKKDMWARADAVFSGEEDAEQGRWKFAGKPQDIWPMDYAGVKFFGRFTPFRHTGFFPEQAPHWDWMVEKMKGKTQPRIMNLFGYTGVASLIAAKNGAQVTHVDASKKAVTYARENQDLSGLNDAPIRWIVEDARKFTAREGRRGKKYDGILVDPPKFGRGADGEVWNLFDDLPEMLRLCKDVLEDRGFLILTSYAIRASHAAMHALCAEIFKGARLSSGELLIREHGGGRLLSTSLYVRVET